jgi:hypothetical protein
MYGRVDVFYSDAKEVLNQNKNYTSLLAKSITSSMI